MKIWRFDNSWDYHELGGFITVAETPEEAAAAVNAFVKSRPSDANGRRKWNEAHPEADWWPSTQIVTTYTAADATEVGPVFVQGGCDD